MTAIYFTLEAQEQALRADEGWREHARTNPDLFWDELLVAQGLAARMKEVYAVYRSVRGEAVRRVLMAQGHYHLYYTYNSAKDEVWVVAVWGARREKGPPLDNVDDLRARRGTSV